MEKDKEFVTRGCRISPNDYKGLKQIKKETGTPISYQIRTAIKRYIKEEEK